MLPSEDVSGPSHVGGQLVDFIKPSIDHLAADHGIAQVAKDKIIRIDFPVFGKFHIHSSDPKSFTFQSMHEMAADETSGAKHEGSLRHSHRPLSRTCFRFVLRSPDSNASNQRYRNRGIT